MNILLVEDNKGDILLVKEALREGLGISYHLEVIKDGEAAVDFLYGCLKKTAKEYPDLIFLDLNLPKKNGQEVLADIKNHPRLRSIPIVVFSTSNSSRDIHESYNLNANCYITKPSDYLHLVKVLSDTVSFWGETVQLPRGG